ncbi:type II toxin-antitoxin system RelE/ParE family toxin [Adlercreutzia aquisgranensis]|uniref:type II toxin-antitoxin system RelE/ParE family toxin n=1 Tax=Adlercreutzia aquisgranensis TaxID=2941323 RepID=UPI00203EF111|nr:type II toxin-antitoxin system RelE/ParE family toxin [Adlercreutzia aquisgranensis]
METLIARRSVTYRPKAAYDIESAVVCVGQVLDSPQAAKRRYEQLQDALVSLADIPTLGKRFDDELLTHHGMRTYRVGQYRLFYAFTEEALTLWRVLYTRHDLDDYALMSLDD